MTVESSNNSPPPLRVLHSRFQPLSHYQSDKDAPYSLLPLRFLRLDAQRLLLTNFAGEHLVLPSSTARNFLTHGLDTHSPEYNALKAKHFLLDSESTVAIDLLAAKYRTKMSHLRSSTGLFIFVTTLRCDHSCQYCQVSRRSEHKSQFDMPLEIAIKGVDFMFESPGAALKVEFQGGETLLNFELVKQVVTLVEERNTSEKRDIAFVVATNLSQVTDEILTFCVEHNILVSTSLDCPAELHNANRHRPGNDSHAKTIHGIRIAREALGFDRVSALMTTTEASLDLPREIVDEYLAHGFSSIFLRSLSPYGFAAKAKLGYASTKWLEFYKTALSRILEINYSGTFFCEEFTTLILRKILSPFPTRYVDLQSPAGIGISCLVFNYNGEIYASDEGRMLAEMGDKTFRLGNLQQHSFNDVMTSPLLSQALSESLTETAPGCSQCAIQPYCGSDPIFHYATQNDFLGKKPLSSFCSKQMEVTKHIITLLEDDDRAAEVFRSWIQ